MAPGSVPPPLLSVTRTLEVAADLGFLGPGPVSVHLDHAVAMAAVGVELPHGRVVDLGTGGGVPGLVLAVLWPDSRFWLVEVNGRRGSFLEEAAGDLGLTDRVEVLHDRAELVGRSERRGSVELVTARSFGPPGVTAECAAPLLVPGGHMVVSEPPAAPDSSPRWPAEGLAELGMAPGASVRSGEFGFQVVRQVALCDDRYPRRVGIPTKRPLF